jgi:hypothetical protein
MKKILVLIPALFLLSVLSGCLTDITGSYTSGPSEPELDESVFLEGTCDALNPCPEGYECGKFLGLEPKCFPKSMQPCEILKCPATIPCVVAESYPIQVFCSYANKAGCSDYPVDQCPSDCVICPPCEECSSITCQNQAFCESIGFDKDWYNSVKP